MLGMIEGGGEGNDRGWNGITDSMDMNLGKLWELVMDGDAWRAVIHGIAKSWTWLRDWTEHISADSYVYQVTWNKLDFS